LALPGPWQWLHVFLIPEFLEVFHSLHLSPILK
jgi:hypothetical protein